MVDFFDRIYSKVQNEKGLVRKIRLYSVIRLIIAAIANNMLPFFFRLTRNNKQYQIKLNKKRSDHPQIVVSLTSFPLRIGRLWMMIESILRQDRKPDLIILWLSKEQFPNYDSVPKSIRRLERRGLIVKMVEGDLRSHKKYYYALQEFPNDYILTLDDDIMYRSTTISNLIQKNSEYPTSITCGRGWIIGVYKDQITPYSQWKFIQRASDEPQHNIMATGVGGILYPPNSLNSDVLRDDIFKRYCFQADDIWLKTMALLNNTPYTKIEGVNFLYLPIIFWKNIELSTNNVGGGENDKQLIAVRNYYLENRKIDPYEKLFIK